MYNSVLIYNSQLVSVHEINHMETYTNYTLMKMCRGTQIYFYSRFARRQFKPFVPSCSWPAGLVLDVHSRGDQTHTTVTNYLGFLRWCIYVFSGVCACVLIHACMRV